MSLHDDAREGYRRMREQESKVAEDARCLARYDRAVELLRLANADLLWVEIRAFLAEEPK